MTDSDGWERQQGGLLLRSASYDRNNPEHKVAALHVMRSTLEPVSLVHGAKLSEKGLYENVGVLDKSEPDDPDLILEFHYAKWEACERKATNIKNHPKILIGGAIGWKTYAFSPDGKLECAHYLEDFAVFKSGVRQLIRSKPEGMDFPNESIAGCLDRISLRNMHAKHGVMYKFGEVAPDNTAMMRQMDNNGARMGGIDSAVLEYERMPGNSLDYFPLDKGVKVRPIWWKGVKSKRSFIVRWKDDDHDVRFIVTKGRATAAGVPRIDIRPWDNDNPPDPYTLECVVAATLRAIEENPEVRKWGIQKSRNVQAPVVPELESRHDQFKTLFRMSGERVSMPGADIVSTFDAPTPSIHVHIIGKKHMIDAFKDAQMRFFGDKPMVPGVNVVRDEFRLAA